MDVHSYLASWHSKGAQSSDNANNNYVSPLAQEAFQDAVQRFSSELTSDKDKADLAVGLTGIQAVQTLVQESYAKYSDGRKHPRTRKWLQRVLSTIHHYSKIMDVLVSHHPEYVALVWGVMKLLLVSAQNHEATVCAISKALAQIAGKLPQVELATVLYPTERMKEEVGRLYALLLRFFIRAHEWCQEGGLRHLIHSLTQPVELRYKDLLDDITEASQAVSQLATAGAQVKIFEIDRKITDLLSSFTSFQALQALQSSAMIDTRQRVTDLQLSQIMTFTSTGRLGDPVRALRFHESLQRRSSRRRFESTNKFWQSPALDDWSTGQASRVAILNGSLRARFAMREFSVTVIRQLQSRHVPVLWALPGADLKSDDVATAGGVTGIDVFKHLVLQALQLSTTTRSTPSGRSSNNPDYLAPDNFTDCGMSIQCTRFQRATTETEWRDLLGSALAGTRHDMIYLVVDLFALDHNVDDVASRFGCLSWTSAFHALMSELARRVPGLRIKVLLLGSSPPSENIRERLAGSPDVVVPVQVRQTPVRKRKHVAGSQEQTMQLSWGKRKRGGPPAATWEGTRTRGV